MITGGTNLTIFAEAPAEDPDDLSDVEAAESRAGIQRGLEAAAAGRVKPFSQAVAEARLRHGFPDSRAMGVDDAQRPSS